MRSTLNTVGIACALWLPVGCSGSGTSAEVERACEEAVRSLLLSPASAVFTNAEVQHRFGNVYKVEGIVDASNAYGAMLRDRFFCVVDLPGAEAFLGDDVIEYYDTLGATVRSAKREDPNRRPPDVVTYRQYERLWRGMPLEQVNQLIGKEGRRAEGDEAGSFPRGSGVTYVWQNYDGSMLRVEFRDGKLVDKMDIGLW